MTGAENGQGTTTVMVVDDDPMVCAHLRTIIDSADDLTVVGETHDGSAAAADYLHHRPDVVLMDIRMPGTDGIRACGQIMAIDPDAVVVVLTTFDIDTYVLDALREGARGFVLKSTAPRDLIQLLRVAASGHVVLSPASAAHLVGSAGPGISADARRRLAELTARERAVLSRLSRGLNNAEIATSLTLSEATIKGYVSQLLLKLGVTNRTQAALFGHLMANESRERPA